LLLIRLLALLGLIWTGKQVVKQVTTKFQAKAAGDGITSEEEIQAEMVKDPVCSTYLPKSMALQKTVAGETWYFCSEECALKFLKRQDASA